MRPCLTTAVAALLALGASAAPAQPYPSRPVKIVVPATPGGAIDLIARTLGEKLTGSLGQPVVVENKPGAANNLGTDFVAKSPPDGYTLVIVASSHATNTHLYKNLPYDPVKDFEPVVYTHVVPLLHSPALGGGVVFVVFDEGTSDTGGGGRVEALALGQTVRRGARFTKATNHYGLLRTIEDAWGLPRLGHSRTGTPIGGIWKK